MAARDIFECGGEHKAAAVEVGYDANGVDARLGDGFEPDGLPDAGDAGVVATSGMEIGALFARWIIAVAGVILRLYDEVVVPVSKCICDVKSER